MNIKIIEKNDAWERCGDEEQNYNCTKHSDNCLNGR